MSDIVNQAAEQLAAKVSGASIDGTIKFDIADEGVIRIVNGDVTTDDGDADCTISGSIDTFKDLFDGELDPTAAFMTGKIKIDGDMGMAMKLSSLLA